jgi:hypothetical protein
MALTGKIAFNANLQETGSVDLGTAAYNVNFAYDWVVASGTAVNQADRLWVDANRTLAASATEDLDVVGMLMTAFGVSLTLVKLKGLFIQTPSTNPGNLTLSRVATGVPLFVAASDAMVIPPGGLFAWVTQAATAVPVTAATADTVTLTAAATPTRSPSSAPRHETRALDRTALCVRAVSAWPALAPVPRVGLHADRGWDGRAGGPGDQVSVLQADPYAGGRPLAGRPADAASLAALPPRPLRG